MAYIVNVEGREFKVDVQMKDGRFVVSLNGKKANVEIAHEQGAELMLIVNDKPFATIVESDSQVLVNGEAYAVEVVDELIEKLIKASPDLAQKKELAVKAVMPGLVIDVNVREGDVVKSGDGLLIIEAMKMQNEIKAARDGLLRKIFIKKGQTVNTGDTLLIIE
ncbi:MAG: biotin/lipoyl-binding protein [candidate division WOR-3 bacterium]|nr:MAG: biotin/lipoyl-binding protein [candidate division WOR-3 bacterium]